MMQIRRRSRTALSALVAVGALIWASAPTLAATSQGKPQGQIVDAEGSFEVLEQADQYAEARAAPAEAIDPGAFTGAYAQAAALPLVSGTWSELTTKPYDSDAQGYRDPVWSNSGGGAGVVGGRTTALAVDGSTLYAGTADGGVWRRVNGTWSPLTDDAPTLSIGALGVDAAHALWVGILGMSSSASRRSSRATTQGRAGRGDGHRRVHRLRRAGRRDHLVAARDTAPRVGQRSAAEPGRVLPDRRDAWPWPLEDPHSLGRRSGPHTRSSVLDRDSTVTFKSS